MTKKRRPLNHKNIVTQHGSGFLCGFILENTTSSIIGEVNNELK